MRSLLIGLALVFLAALTTPSLLGAAPAGAAYGLNLSQQVCAADGTVSATLGWQPSGLGDQFVNLAVDPAFANTSTGGPFSSSANAVSLAGLRRGSTYYARVLTTTAQGTLASDTLSIYASCTVAGPPQSQPAFYISQAPGGVGLSGNVIALTFDDGPGPYTLQVLSVLQAYHVPATFFEAGVNVRQYPQVSQAVAAAGYPIGNHTWGHANLNGLSPADIGNQVDWGQAEIAYVTGQTPACVRPPYNAWNASVVDQVVSRGLSLVSYSVDPRDWTSPGTQVIVDRVVSAVFPGAIVDMHDGGASSQTVAALPLIISTLQARGYTFVAICGATSSTGGAATNFALSSQFCEPDGLVRASFTWSPSGWGEQWADISTLNNDFTAGWYNNGPLPVTQSQVTWDNLSPATVYYARVNTWTAAGWRPGATYSFATIACAGQ